jgi:biotin carboxylase
LERVLVVFPTLWDARFLRGEARAGRDRAEVLFSEPSDSDCSARLDILAHIERMAELARREGVGGIVTSSDYPGAAVAAALAERLGFPGPSPAAVLTSAHKYAARALQRATLPEATPRFELVDPEWRRGRGPPPFFPCFVKPVKGSFSVLARRIEDEAELEAFLDQPAAREHMRATLQIYNRLLAAYTHLELDGSWFLAEEVLRGKLVTVEGFATDEEIELYGVTDALVQPRTGSFLSFVHPSELPAGVQARMEDLTRRAIRALDLRRTPFNVELMFDEEKDQLSIVEVNPRMCGQFADLYDKVHGVHGYDVTLELALGGRPALARGAGAFPVAASVPLRVFEPVRVVRVPSPEELAALEAEIPGLNVWVEVPEGALLDDFASGEDGHSVRYAVVNLGARDRAELERAAAEVRARLRFVFEPLAR